jgi:predicted MPP superfamily phosphohydrolase
MKPSNMNRRRFFKRLGLITAAGLAVTATDARLLEPHWLRIRRISLAAGSPVCRFAYFTDLHYKGDHDYVQSMVDKINALNPDFVCFGGDLVEEKKYAPAALHLLSGIKAPLYGVPGNHDYWSGANFELYRRCFMGTGGAWLMNGSRDLANGKVRLHGLDCNRFYQPSLPVNPSVRNIVLMHYPAWVEKFQNQRFDLMLAGHSHGGQVRIPLIGSLVVPFNVDKYDLGLFKTVAGPLYVNPGIGWYYMNVRFNCRPEVTVFEV